MLFRAGQGSVHQVNLGMAAVYLFLGGAGIKVHSPALWPWLALTGAGLGLAAWFGNTRRQRAITDHPTARVASAPQGYVELSGRAGDEDGFLLVTPLSNRPCVWYRFLVEERRGDKWVRVDAGHSDDTILLEDATGRCLVDPDGAEIHTTHHRTWTRGRERLSEWILVPGDPLYAIGDHVTLGGANADLDFRGDLHDLLLEWKRDKAGLLKRFDLDGNGELDAQEWSLAQQAASREVEKNHLDIRTRPGVHMLRKPRHGRLFLVANISPERLAASYRGWAWAHLGAFALALVGLGWALS